MLAAIIVAGVLLRLRSVPSPGFPSDVGTFQAWAERLASVGPAAFYAPGYFSDYPPGFLYVLWALGALLDGEPLRLAVKAISIPFDVAIALIAARLAARAGGERAGALAAGLWMLSPGVIFAGTHWGQVDAVGTLPFLLALLAASRDRWVAAGVLAGLALMIKPQFGLGLIVLAAAAALIFVRHARWRPAAELGVASFATVLALGVPFRAGPVELIGLVRAASETYPYTSLYAFNPWAVVAGMWQPDARYVVIGGVLLLAGVVAACAPLARRRDAATFLACGALAVFAFYFLPTRAHERYVFPALAALLPFAALRGRVLVPYVALQACFFVTLAVVFTTYDLLHPPDVVRVTLLSRTGEIALALAMTSLAAFIAWRLVRGDARLEPTLALPELRAGRRWTLPAGLAPGRAPSRRDVIVALLVALLVLATRGYRLDHPRDMYFDEVYHARTAFELLAGREVYEWTHPHLAKELMALGIIAFGSDRVVGSEPAPDGVAAFAVAHDGTRAFVLADGSVRIVGAGGRSVPTAARDARAVAVDGGTVYVVTRSDVRTADGRVIAPLPPGTFTSVVAGAGRVAVATDQQVAIHGAGPAVTVSLAAVALAFEPDGATLYALDAQGTVHALETASGRTTRAYPGGPGASLAYVPAPDRVFVGDRASAAIDVIHVESGTRERIALSNARTGSLAAPVTALATVPRAQFLYALSGDRVVVIEPHGASPFASVGVRGAHLGVHGAADELLVAGSGALERIETGRHALAWRLPGVVAGALLAFFLVLLARRLFASALAPALVGAIVLLDGSMYAQARIGMNDVYVAAFLVAAWYFVVAAHAPRRSMVADLVLAGVLFGLAAASKWVAFYALAALGLASLFVTARAYARGAPGTGGPLDLLARRGLNAALLFGCFAVIPVAIYLAAYLPWTGLPTIPYGWTLWELTQQMYWYHSGLTAPHPAGSPWWSWPFVLKPVYWYYGASEGGGSAVIYDAGNVVLFWSAFAATVWCAIAAVRARSWPLAIVLLAMLAQLVAWIPITRVLFFYHFFTALPFYFLALTAALVALWETGRRAAIAVLFTLAAAAAAFFYPFVSGVPVPAEQSGIFFILPTWQYDCQFYPSFTCAVGASSVSPGAVAARLAAPLALLLLAGAVWLLASTALVRERVAAWWPARSPRAR